MLEHVLKFLYLFTYLFAFLLVVHAVFDQVIALILCREVFDVLRASGNVGENF